MIRSPLILILGLLTGILPGHGHAQSSGSRTESLIRLLSPELRRMEQRLVEIDRELETLPTVRERPWGSRYGHRSANLPDQHTPDWLQLDLGEQRTIDMVALVPANLSYRGEEGAGYGFPLRFRVELSEHPDMRDAVVLADRSQTDVPNPGVHPMVFEVTPVSGRYLRITSLKHNIDDGDYFWAIEEVMAMEGVLNVAAGAAEELTHSSCTELFPQWVPVRAIDGQSGLGMPVDVNVPSPSLGYLSAQLDMTQAGDTLTRPFQKWCAIDLGQTELIERVRLLPIESDIYEVEGGRGFPRRMKVQLSAKPDFKPLIWEDSRGTYQLGYPAGCPITIHVPGIEARYVRVIVDRMWSRDFLYVFGLAEIQVYNDKQNLALGKRAYVKDVTDKAPKQAWSPDYLVDGYTSRHKIIEWPEYLRLMDERRRLVQEKDALTDRGKAKISTGKKLLGTIAAMTALLVVIGWIWGMVKHRVLRKREAEQLRQQIARDLHDDIGSNLGGIVLLSEIGSKHCRDEESRDDFESIRKAADEASLSMRDIVWLIQRDPVGLKDFVTKMRQSSRMILKHMDLSFEVTPATFKERPLGLLFRRHVFLAFKEVLNNTRKHAQTNRVSVLVEIHKRHLRFTVRDEGVGFDPKTVNTAGYGMNNLKRRAARVSGSIRINSSPGNGTEVIFKAPFSK